MRLEGGIWRGVFGGFAEAFEEFFQVLGHPTEHPSPLDFLFEQFADENFTIIRRFERDGFKSSGPTGFVFVEICSIVNKRQGTGNMDEAELRDETHRTADRRSE